MRIYLVGFMGSGKSTLGQRIASTLDVPFLDTDSVIESQAGMDITEVFATRGESFFRMLEHDVLEQTKQFTKALISTGGGLPCFHDNMNWMNIHGITIYLQWPDELIISNLIAQRKSRPLIADFDDIEAVHKIDELLKIRKPVYDQSAITIEMTGAEDVDFKLLEKACKYIW